MRLLQQPKTRNVIIERAKLECLAIVFGVFKEQIQSLAIILFYVQCCQLSTNEAKALNCCELINALPTCVNSSVLT